MTERGADFSEAVVHRPALPASIKDQPYVCWSDTIRVQADQTLFFSWIVEHVSNVTDLVPHAEHGRGSRGDLGQPGSMQFKPESIAGITRSRCRLMRLRHLTFMRSCCGQSCRTAPPAPLANPIRDYLIRQTIGQDGIATRLRMPEVGVINVKGSGARGCHRATRSRGRWPVPSWQPCG